MPPFGRSSFALLEQHRCRACIYILIENMEYDSRVSMEMVIPEENLAQMQEILDGYVLQTRLSYT